MNLKNLADKLFDLITTTDPSELHQAITKTLKDSLRQYEVVALMTDESTVFTNTDLKEYYREQMLKSLFDNCRPDIIETDYKNDLVSGTKLSAKITVLK